MLRLQLGFGLHFTGSHEFLSGFLFSNITSL